MTEPLGSLWPLLWLLALTLPAGEADITRGKQIYLTGKSTSQTQISASIGGDTWLSAGILPCVNCHGRDGKGRPESGVFPSNLTQAALGTARVGANTADRSRPAYNDGLLARAVRKGLDSGGNNLQSVMPKYRMNDADMADLIAYLKLLGKEKDPGAGPDKIGIGVLVPTSGRAAPNMVRRVLTAWFEDLNKTGVYGRRIELHFAAGGTEPADRIEALRGLMTHQEVFALLAPFAYGIEKDLADLAADHGVPVIAPLTPNPWIDFPPNPWVFYLHGGIQAQASALLNFAAEESWGRNGGLWLLHPGNPHTRPAVEAVEDLNARLNLGGLQTQNASMLDDIKGLVQRMHARQAEVVFFMGLGSAARNRAFFTAAAQLNWYPRVLIPGDLATAELMSPPPGFIPKTYLAYGIMPGDVSEAGYTRYLRVRQDTALPKQPTAAALWLSAAAVLLEDGLQSAGRDLNRADMVTALQARFEWATGYTPALSFSANRRIGSNGAWILCLDRVQADAPPLWVEAAPARQ